MPPETMHAVRLFEYGGPQVLQYVEAPVPETGPDEVLIRVHATSVTNWDLRYRRGELTSPPGRQPLPLPFQLGREAAGEVALVGENVARFKVGDRVVQMTCPACGHCAYCKRGLDNLCIDIGLPGHQRFGGYADYVCRRQTEVLPAPDGIPFEKLACAMWSYSTAWGMAMDRGALQGRPVGADHRRLQRHGDGGGPDREAGRGGADHRHHRIAGEIAEAERDRLRRGARLPRRRRARGGARTDRRNGCRSGA
jgi:NADPH:quinone reductase-like Zn-dependent oxidoreductase